MPYDTGALLQVGATEAVHVRKTLTFTCAANLGQSGTSATIFSVTGRIFILPGRLSIFCTGTLTGATSTVTLEGVTSGTDILAATTATTITALGWWRVATGSTAGVGSAMATVANGADIAENIVVTSGVADTTGGTLVFDMWYIPITDGATATGD